MITIAQSDYIHQPKTVGTFITDVLFQVYKIDWTLLNKLIILSTSKVSYNTTCGRFLIHGKKHSAVKEIPSKYKNLSILTNRRNSLNLYLSKHDFGWWKRRNYLKY